MPLVTLSQKELHRLEAIQEIRDRRLSVVQAAELLDLSRSQVHRLLQAYDQDGACGLVSKKRGRPSNLHHGTDPTRGKVLRAAARCRQCGIRAGVGRQRIYRLADYRSAMQLIGRQGLPLSLGLLSGALVVFLLMDRRRG